MKIHKNIFALSVFHLVGIGAIQLSIILFFIKTIIALIPLLIFIILCAIAPFFTGLSFFLPVIHRGSPDKSTVALTFDDGPDPQVTPEVLKLLSAFSIKATFFVTGEKASKHPEIIREILSQGHTIGNHSYYHDPLLMLRSKNRLYKEIKTTQDYLSRFNITPYAFRSPAGITNPRLRKVLLELGLYCVNFSCRAFDAGNRKIISLADKIIRKVKAGDIILLHDTKPVNNNGISSLLNEFKKIISTLKKKNLKIISVSELIGKEIMGTMPERVINPVKSFYDHQSLSYDKNQFNTSINIARSKEYQIVNSHLLKTIKKSDKVMEIGAGTGLYTIPIAKRCANIVAVDISGNMLNIARQKSEAENLTNIHFILADIEQFNINEKFDIICSFSSFEYINDLSSLLRMLSVKINPGGMLYFTTAHRSLFRFFTQIGNAMVQGVWLRSRSKTKISKILEDGEFDVIKISSHLFKSIITGGMLLEVIARKK